MRETMSFWGQGDSDPMKEKKWGENERMAKRRRSEALCCVCCVGGFGDVFAGDVKEKEKEKEGERERFWFVLVFAFLFCCLFVCLL